MNYLLVENNNVYTDLYDLLEKEELNMNKEKDNNSIQFHLEKYINNCSYFKLSDDFKNNETRLDNIMEYFDEYNNHEKASLDTLLIYSNDKIMYELMFLETKKEKKENELNQFACITNLEKMPIYNNVIVLKTEIINNKPKSCFINKTDIFDLIYKQFYHTGVIIDNKTKKEIIFTGTNPLNVIGNNFNETEKKEILGLIFILYEEKQDDYLNENVSILFEREIRGRCFLMILCPFSHQKIWDLNENIVNKILNLYKNKKKLNEINSKLFNETSNPFLLI